MKRIAPMNAPKRIVHIQTVVQTIFGVVDEHGNVTEKRPVTVELSVLSQEVFQDAHRQLQEVKRQLAGTDAQQPPAGEK